MEVHRATDVDEKLLSAFGRLIPQLSSHSGPPGPGYLESLIRSDSIALLIAEHSGEIVEALTLVLMRIPTGIRARIEDVVVDQSARRLGVARSLSEAAVRIAKSEGAKTVDLTSRPDRVAANRLYESLGFERRDTHVYRLRLTVSSTQHHGSA